MTPSLFLFQPGVTAAFATRPVEATATTASMAAVTATVTTPVTSTSAAAGREYSPHALSCFFGWLDCSCCIVSCCVFVVAMCYAVFLFCCVFCCVFVVVFLLS